MSKRSTRPRQSSPSPSPPTARPRLSARRSRGAAGTAAGDSSQVTLRIWSGSTATGTPVQTRTATQSAGSWSVAASPALAPGTYTARAEQTDSAGNTGQSAAVTFTAAGPDLTAYRSVVLADGPSAYWRLGETSGNVAANAIGAPNGEYRGGVVLGEPGALSTDPNAAASFDGVDDTVRMPDAAALDPTGALSIEAWIKPTSGAPATTLVRKEGQYMVRRQADGAVTFRLWKSGVTRDFSSAAGVTMPDAWNHVVATWNGSSMEIWVNGILRGSTVLSAPIDASAQPLFVGSVLQSYDWFRGTIDEVAVYGSALSAERILAHYSAAVPLDSTAPAVTLMTPANGSTMDPGPTFGGAAGTAAGDSSQVTLRIWSGSTATGTPVQTRTATQSAGSWSVAASPALAPGTYTARAEQTDSAGNTGQSAAVTFTAAGPDLTAYRSVVLADGPSAYWRLGETSGNVAANAIGAPNGEYRGGVVLGEPGALSTDPNAAASFDGVDDTVRMPDAAALDPTGALSIEAWIKPTSGAPATTLVRKEGQYMVRRQADGAVTFRLWKSGVTRDFSSAAGVTMPDAWNHVVATWNGSSMEIWVNGILRGSTVLSAPIDASAQPLFVGSVLQSYDWFRGTIDEVAVYGSALSAERILAHYSAAVPLDSTAPAVTLMTPANGSTMDPGPTFGGAAGVASGDESDVTVDVYTGASVSGTPIQSLRTTAGPASYSVTAAAPLAPGTYTARASQSDAAGNTGHSASRTFAVAGGQDPTLLAAGDISGCDTPGDEATAEILDRLSGIVVPLGDSAYEDGSPTQFAECFDPTWGRHKARIRPIIGGHEYRTPGAAGYFGYYGAAAGDTDPSRGYYSYDVGAWHVVALNGECGEIAGCWYDEPEERWLREDLSAHPSACTVALLGVPRFSSGAIHGNSIEMQPLWEALYAHGVDVVLTADDHVYERFAPQTPAGSADPVAGIRQFTVGTGGRSHYAFSTIQPNSELRNNDSFGILRLTLHPTAYSWDFVAEAGSTFTDMGTTACH